MTPSPTESPRPQTPRAEPAPDAPSPTAPSTAAAVDAELARLLARSRAARLVWLALGALCVAVGAVGVVVPGLPTTPFLVLAAACFVRGSPRAYTRLLDHPRFGPLIRDFRAGRGIPRRVKYAASLTMLVFVTFALGPGLPDDAFWLRIVVAAAALIGFAYLFSLPNTEDAPQRAATDDGRRDSDA